MRSPTVRWADTKVKIMAWAKSNKGLLRWFQKKLYKFIKWGVTHRDFRFRNHYYFYSNMYSFRDATEKVKFKNQCNVSSDFLEFRLLRAFDVIYKVFLVEKYLLLVGK